MTSTELTSIPKLVSEYATEIKNYLDQNSNYEITSYDLDCSILPAFENGWKECNGTSKFIRDIEISNGHPAIYWFEITSNHTSEELYNYVKELRQTSNRNLPAQKKLFSEWNSKVLYVGKVKNNLAGRMLLHLGYNIAPSVQGLQLCHWQNISNLNLRLNVIYLPKDFAMIAGVFEFKLAQHLKPILGKHR